MCTAADGLRQAAPLRGPVGHLLPADVPLPGLGRGRREGSRGSVRGMAVLHGWHGLRGEDHAETAPTAALAKKALHRAPACASHTALPRAWACPGGANVAALDPVLCKEHCKKHRAWQVCAASLRQYPPGPAASLAAGPQSPHTAHAYLADYHPLGPRPQPQNASTPVNGTSCPNPLLP